MKGEAESKFQHQNEVKTHAITSTRVYLDSAPFYLVHMDPFHSNKILAVPHTCIRFTLVSPSKTVLSIVASSKYKRDAVMLL